MGAIVTQPKAVVLVDGTNLAFRMHHSHITLTSGDKGTGAIYGVIKSTEDILTKVKDAALVYFWEGALQGKPVTSWRRELPGGEEYKGNRKKTADTADVYRQIRIVKKVLTGLGYGHLYVPGLEADDLIGIAAHTLRKAGVDSVYIYSGDRDFFQCINKSVFVLRPEGKGEQRTTRVIKAKDVYREFGVWPSQWVTYKALVGDSTDNYKGCPGCGPVTALKLIQAGVNLEEGFESVDASVFPNLWEHWDTVLKCKDLAVIPKTSSYSLIPKSLRKQARHQITNLPDMLQRRMKRSQCRKALQQFTEFCADYELNSFLANRHRFMSTVHIIGD